MRLINDVDMNTMYPGVVTGVIQGTTRGGRSVCDSADVLESLYCHLRVEHSDHIVDEVRRIRSLQLTHALSSAFVVCKYFASLSFRFFSHEATSRDSCISCGYMREYMRSHCIWAATAAMNLDPEVLW